MNKNDSRLRRARQTRLKIAELNVARLAVHRTNLHIYAQVFSEDGTKVLAAASTAEAEVRKELNGNGGNTGTFRKFGLARNKLREIAFKGEIPGLTKASW